MSATSRLQELGITLPPVAAPVAAYVPAMVLGNHVWTSGQLPFVDGTLQATGKVGTQITPEDAKAQARIAGLNAIAAAAQAAGGLDEISRILKVTVFVASDPSFTGQPAVANGVSELMGEVFGAQGQHVRSAVGVSVLPLDAPVEVELVCEI
ncbi:RidA family protein [Luteococcus sp. Sow4_B9]|uniref:RidA family protein n=1 Tax=Luteococcus sp. Sow4_B9 TaxID=3438792 RepID=UPI003F99651A